MQSFFYTFMKKLFIIQHASFEGPGCVLDWAIENEYQPEYIQMFDHFEFPNPDSVDFLVIMGGPMSVYEESEYPWLKLEKNFIKSVVDAGKHVLGICLGSQLLAEICGAKVYPGPAKEIGWFEVFKTSTSEISNELPDSLKVFHWHGDTFDIPENAVRLFESKAVPNQSFLYNKNVLAFQFHLEVKEGDILNMIENGEAEIVENRFIQNKDSILSNVELCNSSNEILKSILTNFISVN